MTRYVVVDFFAGNGRPKVCRAFYAANPKEAVRKYVMRAWNNNRDWDTKADLAADAEKMVKKLKRVKYGDRTFWDTYLPTGDWSIRVVEHFVGA